MFNKIFSVSNEHKDDKYFKVICILGFKIKIMDFHKELMKEIIHNIDNKLLVIDEKLKTIQALQEEKNIYKEACRLATLSTAQYVMENMNRIEKFPKENATLMDYAIEQVNIDGLYLEFGVFSGISINHISERIGSNKVYGFDSFEGLPEDWRADYKKGTFAMSELPKVNDNVELVKGWFEDSISDFKNKHRENCAFIHVDCDLYSSTVTIFSLLEDRIKSGTVILFDEYFNYPGWENGEFKAFQEFIERTNLKYKYIGYNDAHEQCAVMIL